MAEAGEREEGHVHHEQARDRCSECRCLAESLREAAPRCTRIKHDGYQRTNPAGKGGRAPGRPAAIRLSVDFSGLADMDVVFRALSGRGDRFAHGSADGGDSQR